MRLDAPVLTNGMSLSLDGDKLQFGTAIFGGTTLVDVKLKADGPALIAIRPKSFAAEESGGGAAEVANVATADSGRAAEAKILAQHELFGHQRFLAHMGMGGLEHAKVLRAIELLGTEVAPRVREEVARRRATGAVPVGERDG